MKIVKHIDYPKDNETLRIGVDENNNPWLTKTQIAKLYSMDRTWISRRIDSILETMFIDEKSNNYCSVRAKLAHPQNHEKTYSYYHYGIEVLFALDKKLSVNYGHQLKEFIDSQDTQIVGPVDFDVITYSNNNVSIEVQVAKDGSTLWLTQNQLAILFGTTQQNISLHINNIVNEKELTLEATHKEYLLVQLEGGREVRRLIDYYNFDMILSVGYRVKTSEAIAFRLWATEIIKQYAIKGYVIDEKRNPLMGKDDLSAWFSWRNKVDHRLEKLEKYQDYHLLEHKMFLDDTMFETMDLMKRLLDKAKESIHLIDPFIDVMTLNYFKNVRKDVGLTIITTHRNNMLSLLDKEAFKEQYREFTLKYNERNHDRYLILDKKIIYHLGGSINYLGKKLTQIDLVEDSEIIDIILRRLK